MIHARQFLPRDASGAVEILQSVRVRGERWRIAAQRSYDNCQLLTLVNSSGSRRILTPFDAVEPIATVARPRRVGSRRWRHACRAVLASSAPPGTLRAALRARIELLPHQLGPALAVVGGLGTRLLLADDVGLGKTIQAGLVVAELIARRAADRVLVIAPSGIRDQWAEELQARFAIDASVADARSLRQAAANLPVGVNPWTTLPVAIVSLDYVKRPEVLPAVLAVSWDVVIVDEAHSATGASDRRHAVHALASRAPYVLLLTATPHSGDASAFSSLCATGTVGDGVADPLLLFRRTRRSVRGGALRRVRTLYVRPTLLERRMHEALARYTRAVRDEHGDRALALSVLEKRAFSSPWSLAQSVGRQLASLALPPPDPHQQLALPLDDGGGEWNDEDAPPAWPADLALSDRTAERRLLERVLASAHEADLSGDSKRHALHRLLERVGESALVFTEFRDTAIHLVAALRRPALLLHGGMDRTARRAIVDAFHERPNAVLVSTDAAGQGLNLHRACRLVINVELPWNPMRLEQRIGRVDRIGQTRTVHAVHLVARSTGESRILNRLQARIAAARRTLDVPDPIATRTTADAFESPTTDTLVIPNLEGEAAIEAARVEQLRPYLHSERLAVRTQSPLSSQSIHASLLVGRARGRLRQMLRGHALAIGRFGIANADGDVLESRLFGLKSRDVSLLRTSGPPYEAAIPPAVIATWRAEADLAADRFWSVRLARQRRIVEACATHTPAPFQPTLFDRRAERTRIVDATDAVERDRDARERLASLERHARVAQPQVDLLLLVLPR